LKDAPFVITKKPDFSDLPVSDTLSRLQAFLPMMKQANEDLALRVQLDPKSVDIEFIEFEENEEGDEYDDADEAESDAMDVEETKEPGKQVIQMDLMLVPDDSEDNDDAEQDEGLNEDTDEEELDEEGRPLPQILQAAKLASKLAAQALKPRIEVISSDSAPTDPSES
jgi:hypothetical protein